MNDSKINLLEAPFELSYKYKRSSGPIMSKFFEGLSQKKIFGTKSKAQKVFAPAAEYDPDTREALTEIVEVGPGGTIESWSWVNSPRSHHLLKTPFAFALIKLDGADTAMLQWFLIAMNLILVLEKKFYLFGLRIQPKPSQTLIILF